MTQETRKDPRAKVLTMTVRYKSATLDEFIEHHSYDVSRGGMFIKTPSPFPPGTLLKFEVKISGEQRVMQGVGRVVWKRESSEISDARPAGMGVKFIKIDDESRKVIDQLVSARGDGASAFEQGHEGGSVPTTARPPSSREIPSQVVAPSLNAREPSAAASKPRKATMLGLGAMHAEPESPETAAAEAFFPPAHPDQNMPAPEDRTVMKQAAELLQDALREAGGSLEEVGSGKEAPARDVPKTEPAPLPAAGPLPKIDATPIAPKVTEKSEKSERSVIVNARPRDEVTQPAVRRAAVAAAPAQRRSEPPKSRSAAIQEAAGTAADSGGSGRFLLALVAVAAAAAVIYFLKKPDTAPTPAPEPPVAAETAAPEPTPSPPPPVTATAEPSAAVTASAAPPPAAEAPAPSAQAAPNPKMAAEPIKPVPVPPKVAVVPKPAPASKPTVAKPAPAAKPPKPEMPPMTLPREPAPATPPTAATPSAPAQPPAEPTAKPSAAPKPPKAAPKPPPAEQGDNPY